MRLSYVDAVLEGSTVIKPISPGHPAQTYISNPGKKPVWHFFAQIFFYWLIARSSLGAFSSFKPQVHSSKLTSGGVIKWPAHCDVSTTCGGRFPVSRTPPLASLMHQEGPRDLPTPTIDISG